MNFKNLFRQGEPEEIPEPYYEYIVFPCNIHDGEADFDGIHVRFEKPGWGWVIYEMRWSKFQQRSVPEIKANSVTGYSTRDAALVDILEAAKSLHEEAELAAVETSSTLTEEPALRS